jgi:hypothetical protein
VRPAQLIVAGVCVGLAVVLALFSADLRSWREAMRDGDVRYAAGGVPAPDWSASATLPSGLSRRVLGVDDDRALRGAALAFRRATRGWTDVERKRRERAIAEAQLLDIAGHGSRTQGSQASNLLGVLTFADATSGRRAATPVERSVAAFSEAVRLNPENANAKTNLELLLRLLQSRGQRIGPNPNPGPRGSGRHGAGTGAPGRGY